LRLLDSRLHQGHEVLIDLDGINEARRHRSCDRPGKYSGAGPQISDDVARLQVELANDLGNFHPGDPLRPLECRDPLFGGPSAHLRQ
jgi:hypothetical protein